MTVLSAAAAAQFSAEQHKISYNINISVDAINVISKICSSSSWLDLKDDISWLGAKYPSTSAWCPAHGSPDHPGAAASPHIQSSLALLH